MNLEVKGDTVVDTTVVVEARNLHLLERALGTASAAETARLVPFFGPTAAGQDAVIGPLGLDLRRALHGGQSYEWHRPFLPGERVGLRVRIEDIAVREAVSIATVVSEYRSTDGELIQRQQTTFVERNHKE